MRGFLSNVFNPKSVIFFVSVVPRFVETESGALAIPIQMAVLGCLYVGIATMVHATIVVMAVQLKAVAYRWKTTGHNAPSVVRGPRLRGGMAGLDHETLNSDPLYSDRAQVNASCPLGPMQSPRTNGWLHGQLWRQRGATQRAYGKPLHSPLNL